MTPDARRLLDSIRAAGSLEITASDPLQPVAQELIRMGFVRRLATSDVYKERRPGRLPVLDRVKTTDTATPDILPVGSRSGLIPPAVTSDPRITRTPRTDPRK